MTPRMELAGVVLDSPDAQGLSRFYQAQDDVRVYLDPDGHPFCLFGTPAMTRR